MPDNKLKYTDSIYKITSYVVLHVLKYITVMLILQYVAYLTINKLFGETTFFGSILFICGILILQFVTNAHLYITSRLLKLNTKEEKHGE